MFTSVDHYARLLARLADSARAPEWADTLTPAVDAHPHQRRRPPRAPAARRVGPEVVSAESEVNAAEVAAARCTDPRKRGQLLVAARLLRRMDQAVVGFAVDLGAPRPEPEPASDLNPVRG